MAQGGRETLEKAESWIAKMVDSGEERKSSGEICRRAAKTLKPPRRRRAREALTERL